MKTVLSFALLFSGKHVFGIRDIENIPGRSLLEFSSTKESERLSSVNGLATYRKEFVTFGRVNKFCFDHGQFCDPSRHGKMTWLFCAAAQKAKSRARAGWAVSGNLNVGTSKNSNINDIDLATQGVSGTMAVSFAEADARVDASADTFVGVDTEQFARFGTDGSQRAAVLGMGNSGSRAIAFASANSLSSANGQTASSISQDVIVKGRKLTKFEGGLASFAENFAESGGSVEGGAVAGAASSAFSKAFAEVKNRWNFEYNPETDDAKAREVAKLFGAEFSRSLSRISVGFTVDAAVKDMGDAIDISMLSTAGTFASNSCISK